ncbi:metallophosphoesterase [Pigmentibacter sp. JX0631]|uniref:metallophosphoesterase n=1 Tax=Pigmentibacter sp. JX0631 TaxID=2976982 RepID=UPI002468EB55|nr:metallophosphoesterase [Pigmentibacter sp. JX0631]WGL58652.1 metallophosphoesterase [Pigmentibacter sp. JX0631]
MRTVKIENIKSFVVISDVHLREPGDLNSKFLLETLEKIKQEHLAKKIDAIIFLGDIFDFITVSKHFFIKLWINIFDKIKELKNLGMKTIFLEGNHDFGFEHFHSKKLDEIFSYYGDFILEFDHPDLGRTVMRHGDNLICLPSYQKPRAFFKSYLFQKIANLFVPGFLMHFICTNYAKRSRNKGETYNALTAPFLKNCLEDYFKSYKENNKTEINTLVLGHIHVYLSIVFQKVQLLVGPDWFSNPNYLIFHNSNENRRVFTKNENIKQFDIFKP